MITGNRHPVPLVSPFSINGDNPPVAGRRLGNYELIESVGAGGMAAVLKARDLELGRIVALKILPPEAARDPECVTRFKQEARAAARLDHDNIARVYSCGEDQGLHFIAFEFVEGENLRQKIERRKTIPAGECIRYMIQVAAGLAHAAERGIVHRDIKPSNIIITPSGRAKIVDMGLARQLDIVPANGGVTQSGVTLGTFDYISPEQALDPRQADIRSDIYSLGCAFYHALTGRPPVPEGTAAKKLHAHQHLVPLDPRQINPNIPDELVALLARMMAKRPEQRPQTPAELIANLKALAERLNLSPDVIGHDSVVRAVPAELTVPQPPRLRLGWVLAAAGVCVAFAALGLSTGAPGPRPTPPSWADELADDSPYPPAGEPTGSPGPAVAPADGIVRTVEQLVARLKEPHPDGVTGGTRIRLAAGEFDLSKYPEPVTFLGKDLELVGSVSPPTVLRVRPVADTGEARPGPGTFVIRKADTVTISGIRLETAGPATPPATATEARLAALALDSRAVHLIDCVFAADLTAARHAVGGLRLVRSTAEGPTPRVVIERCLFVRGDFAVWLPDTANLEVNDSGFGSHEVVIRVGEPGEPEPVPARSRKVTVRLERSSFQMDTDTAVVAEAAEAGPAKEPGIEVTAGYCVFAHTPLAGRPDPGSPTTPPRRPVLLRANPGRAEAFRFKGQPGRKNVYYRVEALAVGPPGGPLTFRSFEECKRDDLPIEDAAAVFLTQRPWAEPDIWKAITGREPWRAFGLRTNDAALAADNRVVIVGAQFHEADRIHRAYPNQYWPLDLPKPASSERRTLVWEPDARDDVLPKDTFNDLAFLLTKVRAGDEVLIRHNGPVPVERVELKPRVPTEPGSFRLTFKPFPGYQPVLTAAGDEKLNQTLFLVPVGSVRFEGLHFQLKPSRPRRPQRVVAAQLADGAEACSFVDCTFTLAEEDEGRVAVVSVDDPENEMMMTGTSRTTPRVKLERCVLRGRGRGVWVPVSRPVEVELVQTLTALDGPLYLAEHGGKLVPGVRSQLRLSRVTAFVGGPVVELHGGRVGAMRKSGLVPLEVQAEACLFAAVPGAGRSLVEFNDIDATELEGKILEWKAPTPNRYADFDPSAAVMLLRPASEGVALKEWNWDQWITFAGEAGGKPFGSVTFENPPRDLKALGTLRPADATVKAIDFPDLSDARLTDAGTTERLPVPPNEP